MDTRVATVQSPWGASRSRTPASLTVPTRSAASVGQTREPLDTIACGSGRTHVQPGASAAPENSSLAAGTSVCGARVRTRPRTGRAAGPTLPVLTAESRASRRAPARPGTELDTPAGSRTDTV